MFLSDGSGLSRFNAVTPAQMATVLLKISQTPVGAAFRQTLPGAGSGTIQFAADKFPEGSLQVKSGSMTRVRCYAGYMKTVSGKDLAFAVMLNNFACSQSDVVQKIEELLVELRKL